MGFLFKLLARLHAAGDVCPVCKEEPPEYWAQGRVKKYLNGCCSATCNRNSVEFRDEEKRSKKDEIFGRAKKAADRRELAPFMAAQNNKDDKS